MNIHDFKAGEEFNELKHEIRKFKKRLNTSSNIASYFENNIGALEAAYKKYMKLAKHYGLPEERTEEVTGWYNSFVNSKP